MISGIHARIRIEREALGARLGIRSGTDGILASGGIVAERTLKVLGTNNLTANVSSGDELTRLTLGRMQSNAVVAEMIVEILELEARDELVEQSGTFVDLGLEQVGVPARLQCLTIAVLLDTLDTGGETRRAARVLGITLQE